MQNFGEWGDCSVTCGAGTQNRHRDVATKPAYGGKACPYTTENRGCNDKYCPADCDYEWGDWGGCSENCGGGLQYRSPKVAYKPANDGKACPSQEKKACNTAYCSVDCVVHDWKPWSKCTTKNDKKCGMGIISRQREVKYKAQFGGKKCPHLYEEKDCNKGKCAVDCKYDWGSWGECTHSCGGGHMYKAPKISVPAYDGSDGTGKTCPPKMTKTCNSDYCKVDCSMSEWGDWGHCDHTCGDGYQSRTRSTLYEAKYGGKKCGDKYQKKNCFVEYCAVDCDYEWGEWSACTYTCGGGHSARKAKVAKKGRYGGKKCPADESKHCGGHPCQPKYRHEALTYAKFPDYTTSATPTYEGKSTTKAARGYKDYTGTDYIKPFVARAQYQAVPATYAPTPMPIYETICLNDCVHARDGECDDGGKNAFYKHCKVGHDCADCGERQVPLDTKAADALRAQLPASAFGKVHHLHGQTGDYVLAPKMYDVTDHDYDLKGFKAHKAVAANNVDDDKSPYAEKPTYAPTYAETTKPTYAPTYAATKKAIVVKSYKKKENHMKRMERNSRYD